MKIAVYAAASAAVLVALAAAQPASAQDAEIRHAVARVIVIPEDRADIGVEITQGSANLPQLRVERRGSKVMIDGGLGRRRNLNPFSDSGIRNCNNGPADARQPGDGATIEVRSVGRIRLEDAPLIVLRTPRDVDVNAGDGVFGSVGRGARSVELGAGGCGGWTVANVDGRLEINVGGSGSVRAGTSRSLEANVGGSGSIIAGATGALDAGIGGSGDIVVARADGAVDIAIGGSGSVRVRGGSATSLEVAIGGSGDVRFDGTAASLDASIAGSGDVRVREVTGPVSRAIVGSGEVLIGR
ncbi:GIN domain-containing protein [Brevundimonas faecalis]|uniref:Putative auto-transporter adhesin head GIN domain-containing protein n=1 Tax=Brevundimonas faecalis TaxID=947378 RepID=A0ABV2R911_9CAUL